MVLTLRPLLHMRHAGSLSSITPDFAIAQVRGIERPHKMSEEINGTKLQSIKIYTITNEVEL